MNFRTQVQIPEPGFKIDHSTKMMLFGSCFSENIGTKLIQHKFNAVINPFGILFNPLSISLGIDRLMNSKEFTEDEIVSDNNLFHSFMHHSSFSRTDKSECLDNINSTYNRAAGFIEHADVLMVTFGTAYAFKLKKNDKVVSNCHKFNADNFIRYRLTVDDIVKKWGRVINQLNETNPGIRFIFTVSPVRHWKDGAHDNQLSKSILHLSIDELQRSFQDKVSYFPSYEIVIDELRDYRFYEEDMMHPNSVAHDWIWSQFSATYFSKSTENINKEWSSIRKSLEHRPLHPDTDTYRDFILQTSRKLDEFAKKYPMLNCEEDKQFVLKQLR